MSAGSDNKEAAWTFLSWLQSTDGGQGIYTSAGEIFPALRSTARSAAFLDQDAAPANRQAFLTEGDNAKVGRFGYFPEWGELDGSIISPGINVMMTFVMSVSNVSRGSGSERSRVIFSTDASHS